MSKVGRPKKEIDFDALEKLCHIQCTAEEISAYFDVSIDTIERRIQEEYDINFAEYFAKNRGKGKISLRRVQFQSAMSGNTTMMVWLGKNWLNQTDKQEIEHTGTQTIRVDITDD